MKKILYILVSFIILNSVSFAFTDFSESHWAYNNVTAMQEKGIISGFSDNTFRPENSLTREQFITMAVKGLNITNKTYENIFVDNTRWSKEYIDMAGSILCDEGVIQFKPIDNASREDVAMALVKLRNLENSNYNLKTLNQFSDSNDISENRKKYVSIAIEQGLMSGNANGTFRPQRPLTRAEGATVIYKLLNNLSSSDSKWNKEYISNLDGLTKVSLKKITDNEVEFCIKGKKDEFFGWKNKATINGEIAKHTFVNYDFEKDETLEGEIIFSFDNNNLVVTTTVVELLEVFAGVYQIDNGSITAINREENEINGYYTNESIELTIENATKNSAHIQIFGYKDGMFRMTSKDIEKNNKTWKTNDGKLELVIEGSKIVIIDAEGIYSGEYIKKEYTDKEIYEKYEEKIEALNIQEGVIINGSKTIMEW